MAVRDKKLVKVYVPLGQAEELDRIAETEQRSVSGLIRLAITALLEARRVAA